MRCIILNLTLTLFIASVMSSSNTKLLFYFAYGSNMLNSRIHHNNPTAIKQEIGKLKNYQLDFITYSKRWKGAAATIAQRNGSEVWGVIYKVTEDDIKSLDKQEGVHLNIYTPLTVDVETFGESGNLNIKKCRTYQQTALFKLTDDYTKLPEDRQPSWTYLNTLIEGAKESKIPEYYIQKLNSIKHNNISDPAQLNID